MTVRDAAVADIVPKMTDLEGYGGFNNPRLIYNLGHAVFEFIESRWGKEGAPPVPLLAAQDRHRRRRRRLRGSARAQARGVRPAVREVPEGSLQAVPRQGAAGRLRPQPRAEPGEDAVRQRATRIEPSPSGDLIAVVTGNRKDGELDIVLLSAKDGSVIRNLTHGFDQDHGFEYIVDARRPLEHGAVDVVVARRRSPRLLRAHREAASR